MSVFRRAAQRRGTPADYLVVGLGNPGDKFLGTRHNLGYEVIDKLAARESVSLEISKTDRARKAFIQVAGKRVVLACPTTFMNLSGESVASLIRRNGVDDVARLIVVHDELDLEPGRVKVKRGGSAAGHNGLKSINNSLKSSNYARLRFGIDNNFIPGYQSDYVLGDYSKEEQKNLIDNIELSTEIVLNFCHIGIDRTMNKYN